MNLTDTPIVLTAALFVSLLFLDLFRHEYKLIPVHALLGFFSVLLMTVLCDRGYYFVAWAVLIVPFLILFAGFTMREHRLLNATNYPTTPINLQQPKRQPAPPAPYYM